MRDPRRNLDRLLEKLAEEQAQKEEPEKRSGSIWNTGDLKLPTQDDFHLLAGIKRS